METRKNRILANIEFLKSTEEVYEDGPWPDIMTRDEMKEHGVEQWTMDLQIWPLPFDAGKFHGLSAKKGIFGIKWRIGIINELREAILHGVDCFLAQCDEEGFNEEFMDLSFDMMRTPRWKFLTQIIMDEIEKSELP